MVFSQQKQGEEGGWKVPKQPQDSYEKMAATISEALNCKLDFKAEL